MKILNIETSSSLCSIAILHENGCDSVDLDAPMQQAQQLLPLINGLLQQQNVVLAELSAIAFGCGPGSFTGIRIGTCAAQGLGFALNIPVIPISSLAAQAQTAYDQEGFEQVIVATDARSGEIYWGCYQKNNMGLMELINQEILISPHEVLLPDTYQDHHWYGVGNAWDRYAEILPSSYYAITICQPRASSVAKLAEYAFRQKHYVAAWEAMPHYLHNPFKGIQQ